MRRREFIGYGAGVLASAALAPRLVAQQEQKEAPWLDAHVHPRSQTLIDYARQNSGRQNTQNPLQPVVDGAELTRRLDADGIHRAFVMSTAYQMAADVRPHTIDEGEELVRVQAENDFAARECARFPDRLVPFLSLNPKRSYAIEEIARCVETHKMRGLKLHFWNSMVDTRKEQDLARVRAVVQYAAERNLPVLAHIFVGGVDNYGPDDTTRLVREVIEPTPKLRICLAHLAGAGGFAEPAQRCFARLCELCGPDSALAARVWVDMAAVFLQSSTPADVTRAGELLRQFGLNRVLWGSDSMTGALARTKTAWPLGQKEWDVIRENRGEKFCA